MPTKNPIKNREYVAKSRQKLINALGIEEYRRRMAQKQREYRAKKKAIQRFFNYFLISFIKGYKIFS
jgi:hypothetical protein